MADEPQTTVTAGNLYPVAPFETVPGGDRQVYRARATGEHRPPRKGEWYLSGARVEGYKAPGNMSTAYHICELVRGELVWQPVPADCPCLLGAPPHQHSIGGYTPRRA